MAAIFWVKNEEKCNVLRVATRPFDVGPSNFHTMTSLGSHVFFESFNEKGKKILKLEKYGFSWFWNDLNQVLPFCRTIPTITKGVDNVPFTKML